MPTKTVFLSYAPDEKRSELKSILERAGMNVITGGDSEIDHTSEEVKVLLDKADCSLHILDPHVSQESLISIVKNQFILAKKESENRPGFKIFIWQTGSITEQISKSKQAEFINEILKYAKNNRQFS